MTHAIASIARATSSRGNCVREPVPSERFESPSPNGMLIRHDESFIAPMPTVASSASARLAEEKRCKACRGGCSVPTAIARVHERQSGRVTTDSNRSRAWNAGERCAARNPPFSLGEDRAKNFAGRIVHRLARDGGKLAHLHPCVSWRCAEVAPQHALGTSCANVNCMCAQTTAAIELHAERWHSRAMKNCGETGVARRENPVRERSWETLAVVISDLNCHA